MYAVAYDTGRGYGSVGLLGDIRGEIAYLRDPVLGDVVLPAADCYHVIWTEGGQVLPFVTPVLSRSMVSDLLQAGVAPPMAANVLFEDEDEDESEREAETFAEEGETEFEPAELERPPAIKARDPSTYVSGYPVAWARIRRWREGLAPDWRTVALVLMFAVSTIRAPIQKAEAGYRHFGPILRKHLEAGTYKKLTAEEIVELPHFMPELTYRYKAGVFIAMMEYAPWLAAQIEASREYSRRFRDMIAVEWVARGIGAAKLSFALMLLGRDAACIDTRMLDYFYPIPSERAAAEESWRRSHHAGTKGLSRRAVAAYRAAEEKLTATPFFDPEWPCPYAKAQWLLWETLGRPGDPGTDHAALWEVLGI